jgi:hypothetical protein
MVRLRDQRNNAFLLDRNQISVCMCAGSKNRDPVMTLTNDRVFPRQEFNLARLLATLERKIGQFRVSGGFNPCFEGSIHV